MAQMELPPVPQAPPARLEQPQAGQPARLVISLEGMQDAGSGVDLVKLADVVRTAVKAEMASMKPAGKGWDAIPVRDKKGVLTSVMLKPRR